MKRIYKVKANPVKEPKFVYYANLDGDDMFFESRTVAEEMVLAEWQDTYFREFYWWLHGYKKKDLTVEEALFEARDELERYIRKMEYFVKAIEVY